MLDVVYLPAVAIDEVLAYARRDMPHKTCGLLVGTGLTVTRLAPTANADDSVSRYTIPAAQHFAAIRQARRDGLEVIGAYHSHPRGAAVPSPADTATAFPGFVFVIAGLEPQPQLRAWHLVGGNFVELRVVRT